MKHVLIPSEENLQTFSIQTFSQSTHNNNFIPQSWFSKHIATLLKNITLLMDPVITVKLQHTSSKVHKRRERTTNKIVLKFHTAITS